MNTIAAQEFSNVVAILLSEITNFVFFDMTNKITAEKTANTEIITANVVLLKNFVSKSKLLFIKINLAVTTIKDRTMEVIKRVVIFLMFCIFFYLSVDTLMNLIIHIL